MGNAYILNKKSRWNSIPYYARARGRFVKIEHVFYSNDYFIYIQINTISKIVARAYVSILPASKIVESYLKSK